MYHYAYDGVMSAENDFLRGKNLEKYPKKGDFRPKYPFYI